jgi:hypothetical protein
VIQTGHPAFSGHTLGPCVSEAGRQIKLAQDQPPKCYFSLTLRVFIPVCHTIKLNYRIIIVITVQCDSIRIYLLPLHVSVS